MLVTGRRFRVDEVKTDDSDILSAHNVQLSVPPHFIIDDRASAGQSPQPELEMCPNRKLPHKSHELALTDRNCETTNCSK